MVLRCTGAVVGLCLAVSTAGAQDLPPPQPADAVEMIELMLGRVPSRHDSPLAAMHGLADLYGRGLEQARSGTPGAAGLWLLLGDVALRSTDAGLTQSYAADMLPLYRQQPDAILLVLTDAPWLAPSTCHHLSAYFGSEDRPEDGRAPFLASETPRIAKALPEPVASACLEALATPR